MYIYGKRSVLQRLVSNPGSVKKVLLAHGFADNKIQKLIKRKNIPFERVAPASLYKKIKRNDHDGIVAFVSPYEYASLYESMERKRNIVCLDGVLDPNNLGAIIRTAACFGNTDILIPKQRVCSITPTVLHIACGGENYAGVIEYNITNAIIKMKDAGYSVYVADANEGEPIGLCSFDPPLCIVLGSETEGVSKHLAKYADKTVNIPLERPLITLNVSVSAGILLFAANVQKTDV